MVVRTALVGAARFSSEAALSQGCCEPHGLPSSVEETQTRTIQMTVHHFPNATRIPLGWDNTASQNSFDYYRMVNHKNRLLGGVVLQAHRNFFTKCGDGVFAKLLGWCHNVAASTTLSSAYSADGIFQIGNEFYDHGIAKDQHLYYPDPADLNQYGVPYGFRAFDMQGTKGAHSASTLAYPVVLDINLNSLRAGELVDFLEACDYFDLSTSVFTVQLLTYKVQDEGFTRTIFTVRADPSGSLLVTYELGGMRTRWHANTKDTIRILLQLGLLIFFLIELGSEVVDFWQAWRKGADVWECVHVFKWIFMAFFTASQIIYVRLLVAMDRFDIDARYHIYESLTGHDESGTHVNWLQLHSDGEKLSKFAQKLADFAELLELNSEYRLFTAITVITALVQVLKLMDFHPDIGMVTRTVRQGGTDLINFVGLLITVLVMYAIMGHIIFGSSLASFSKLSNSFRTCFVMMMGDTAFNDDLYTLGESYETVGSLYFVTFMILVFLFLLSAFLGIIVSAMDEVKAQHAGEEKADLFSDIRELTAFYAKTAAYATWRLLKRHGLLRRSTQHRTIPESALHDQLRSWHVLMGGTGQICCSAECRAQSHDWENAATRPEEAEKVVSVKGVVIKPPELERELLDMARIYGLDSLLHETRALKHSACNGSVVGATHEQEAGVADIGIELSDDEASIVRRITAKIMKHLGRTEAAGLKSEEEGIMRQQASLAAALKVIGQSQDGAEDESLAAALITLGEQLGHAHGRLEADRLETSAHQAGAQRTSLTPVSEQAQLEDAAAGSSASAVPVSLRMRHAGGTFVVSAVSSQIEEQSGIRSLQRNDQVEERSPEGTHQESGPSPLKIESARSVPNREGIEFVPENNVGAPARTGRVTCDNALFEERNEHSPDVRLKPDSLNRLK
ncbi:hypothetical protein CYMTET_49866 [Cymbomonas tetramitiformis]|uniref:Polycystin cation channel PKD1/PKD2 domain-containing protein n=1 Tax=Cymbomonas tetramitiformis TaxID=36881 RepID=A0AAE0ETG5_9CHLO|nr:hypothetical protein CYMTET_49866 [Cymbomonas tetramitiformis]